MITLINAPCVLQVPIIENNEPLVELKTQGEIAYGPSPEIPNNQDYTRLRLTVYNKLIAAQKLLPANLRLCVYEGYRSLDTQEKIFNDLYQKVQTAYPAWDLAACFEHTTKLVSPVINQDGTLNIPPHSTGGAVDLYLIDSSGNLIDMGLPIKDWANDVDGKLITTNSSLISTQARLYREIMCTALSAVDFVNYPTEYCHWSFGDRYWAYHKQADHAIYGPK